MPLITITHPAGSEGMSIAGRVAQALNTELYDDARLREEARRMGVEPEGLGGFQERAPEFFERIFTNRPEIYQNLTASVMFEVARRGEGVIVGHGSQVLLKDFRCALHVLVQADDDTRVRSLMLALKASREAAVEVMRRSDRFKKGYFRYAFDKDWNDPCLYDLCVNPAKIGVDAAARIIVDTASSPELGPCSVYAIEAMERLAQTRRVQAALYEIGAHNGTLRVEMPQKGRVRISGALYRHEDKDRIPARLKDVPGVEAVQMDVAVIPEGYA
jgi:cytidylate kinase